MAAAVGACTPVDVVDDAGADATIPDGSVGPGTDAAIEDSGPRDGGSLDAVIEAAVGDRITVTTTADQLTGELIHVYDHSVWWDAEDERTWALFVDPNLELVPRSTITNVAPAPNATSYRDRLRATGVTLDRPPLTDGAFIITAHETYHLEENGFGDFAWDFVRIENGARFFGDGSQNADYAIWDEPVFLPTAGTVVELEDTAPDHPPGPWPDGAVNNLIGVSLGGDLYLYLLHLRQGSIPTTITTGSTLAAGALVGRVGNSGISLEPHLHVTLLFYDDPSGRSWSVPSEFRDVAVRTGTTTIRHDFVDPPSGVYLLD